MTVAFGQAPVPLFVTMLKGIVALERWLKAEVTERVDAVWWIAQRGAFEDKLLDVVKVGMATAEPLDLADIEVMLACPDAEVRELGLLAARMAQAA